MSKRAFTQVEPSSPDLPLKRIHTSTPGPGSTASAGSAFSTPYTPSVYSIPADSPTNPLGLKRRVNNLTLPKATPFSKHIALRFQLITPVPESTPPRKPSLWNTPPDSSPATDKIYSKNPAAEQYAREGTYRIIQVPLSYSFRLLRAVILFMLSGDPSAPPRAPGHLFTVQHGISIGSPGEIARGRVRVKLSRARDPYYSSRSLADLIAAADAQGQGEEDLEDEEEDASWRWEGEDDFTLGHVWEARSRDPKRGIVYVRTRLPPLLCNFLTLPMQHHDDKTSVHITLNTQTVPHRKGVGNMPFAFRAYGTAHLDSPRSPRAASSTPASGTGSTAAQSQPPQRIFPAYKRRVPSPPPPRARLGEGEGDTDLDGSSSDEDDFDGGLDTRVWNRTGAFPRLISLVRASARTSSSSSSSSSSLSRSRSQSPSPICPPSPTSSPARSSSPSLVSTHGVRRAATMPYSSSAGPSSAVSSAASLSLPTGSASWAAEESSSPVRSLPSLTPAPARPRTRYRVARAARRLLGLTERGLESEAAEEADIVEGRAEGQSKKGARKDRARSQKEKERARARARVTATRNAAEVWNPFAHLTDI